MDHYLAPNANLLRLINEFERYGSITVGFDFDGTVHDYHKTGESYEMVRQLLRDLKEIGCTVICWTAYKDLNYVANHLNEINVPFDGINTDGIPLSWESRKPFFSALLDDRAGLESMYRDLHFLVNHVKAKRNGNISSN